MTAHPHKPKDVSHAEWALWVWIVLACPFGAWYEWATLPDVLQMVTTETQGLVVIDPNDVLPIILPGYALVALLAAWIVVKLGQGRQWARASVLWGLIFQVLIIPLPPFHPLADIPNIAPQLLATILLYRPDSRAWFEDKNGLKKAAKTSL